MKMYMKKFAAELSARAKWDTSMMYSIVQVERQARSLIKWST